MTKTPNPQVQKMLTALQAWFEKSGLKSRLEPQIARFRALDSEKKKQTWTGLVFALVAADLLLVMAPLITSYVDIHQKAEKTAAELDLAVKDIGSKEHVSGTLKTSEASLEQTGKRIFEGDEVHQFLDVLSAMAKESRIKIESLTPIPIEATPDRLPYPLPKGYSLAGYELLGQAGYHELALFIQRLETGAQFVRVDNLDIYHEESDSRRIHQIKLRFSIIRRD